jgi:hypothetical protein
MKTNTNYKSHNRKPANSTDPAPVDSASPPAQTAESPLDSESLALPGREAEESEVRKLHTEWSGFQRTSLEVAIKTGGILAVLKADLRKITPKRNWESYVRNHLGIEPRTASNYMRIFHKSSNPDTINLLQKSETISEIGIRDALNILAELNKSASGEAGSKNDTNRKSSNTGPPPFRLADGSSIELKRLQWADGLISRRSLESWISRINQGDHDPNAQKIEARRQRAVVQIAAGINRACGKAKPEIAAQLVDSSFNVIRTLMAESKKPS